MASQQTATQTPLAAPPPSLSTKIADSFTALKQKNPKLLYLGIIIAVLIVVVVVLHSKGKLAFLGLPALEGLKVGVNSTETKNKSKSKSMATPKPSSTKSEPEDESTNSKESINDLIKSIEEKQKKNMK